MSDENTATGRQLYAEGDAATRAWFERQWSIWPKRADERFTTNLSFHWGGVCRFREENGRDPVMSKQFAEGVRVMDGHLPVEETAPAGNPVRERSA